MSTINARRDAQTNKMAAKAADLGALAQAVWTAPDLELKRAAAIEMASHFEVGGRDAFVEKVKLMTTTKQIDQIVGYAMLKGEGKGTKRF